MLCAAKLVCCASWNVSVATRHAVAWDGIRVRFEGRCGAAVGDMVRALLFVQVPHTAQSHSQWQSRPVERLPFDGRSVEGAKESAAGEEFFLGLEAYKASLACSAIPFDSSELVEA